MDILTILNRRYLESEWTLFGEEYSGLTWYSETVKPTKATLEKLWPEVQREVANEAVEQARFRAYRETSDPVFFQYQRGAKTEADWLAAVEAVKTAHPYPEA
jgi:hypothetical protein